MDSLEGLGLITWDANDREEGRNNAFGQIAYFTECEGVYRIRVVGPLSGWKA